jgi:hypothetical protein
VLIFEHSPPFVLFSSADASEPKRSKQGAGYKAPDDDTATRQSVPSVAVDPSLNVAGHAAGAPLKQTLALFGEFAMASTLSTTAAPKVLKVRELNVKKSSL